MEKKPGRKPKAEESLPSAPETFDAVGARRRLAEMFHTRITKILEVVIRKWEEKVLDDPGYQVQPSDIAAIMKTLQATEDLLFQYSGLDSYLSKARSELKRLEGGILALLSGGEPG
jgi:hypothetical protein